jgi:hypothetical protein
MGRAVGLADQRDHYTKAWRLALDPRHRRLAGEAAVHQHGSGAHVRAGRAQGGEERLFVVGCLGDAGSDDLARGGFHSGLRAVGSLKVVLGRHEATFRVGEVDLIFLAGRGPECVWSHLVAQIRRQQ